MAAIQKKGQVIGMKKAEILTPVVTAFDAKGNIDVTANQKIYEYLIGKGIDGLVVMGSTGEFFSMTKEQKKQLIDVACQYADKTKVLIGTGGMVADETVELSNYALAKGAHAVMIVSPYYFKFSQETLETYYGNLASQINGNIYIYNFPARTGYDVSPEVTLRLARKHANIVGYKDTVTEMGHTRKLIDLLWPEFPDFVVLSGFEEFMAHNVISGGNGCIGGLSNVCPELFHGLAQALNEKKFDEIIKYQKIVDQAMELYEIGDPFIPILKEAMVQKGILTNNWCTVPMPKVTADQCEKVRVWLKKMPF
ncbi:dihydrodipicolinate synthase family protein [Acidaminococcus timonensis]|uniref:dihydrodipicolinate synthase family protein n=1 Tax=Acidaminococcus timonensis TaxID=1871002 RepID=UPI00294375AC|nr:dihydrodipicolinate synthase family protein [Acidaminococcus timonensis]